MALGAPSCAYAAKIISEHKARRTDLIAGFLLRECRILARGCGWRVSAFTPLSGDNRTSANGSKTTLMTRLRPPPMGGASGCRPSQILLVFWNIGPEYCLGFASVTVRQ